MEAPPKVLLKFLGVSVNTEGAVPADLAVLGGTVTVLLGEEDSVAGSLAMYAAGLETPSKGKVLVGSGMWPATSREGKASTGYVSHQLETPPDMTARGCVNLAVTASAGRGRAASTETSEILKWLDLETVAGTPIDKLNRAELQRTAMAVSMATSPELLVMNSPLHDSLHPQLQTFARAGNAVLIRASSLGEIPPGVERIALCDSRGIVRIVRHSELLRKAMGGAEIEVAFYPSLPRDRLETISGIRNLLHNQGRYRFTHSETSFAVVQLMNIARANSRAVAYLQIKGMPPSALIAMMDRESEKAMPPGLFNEEEGF